MTKKQSCPKIRLTRRSSATGNGSNLLPTHGNLPQEGIRARMVKCALIGLFAAMLLMAGNARSQIALQDGSLSLATTTSSPISKNITVTSGASVLVVNLFDRNGNANTNSPANLTWNAPGYEPQILARVAAVNNGASTWADSDIYYVFNPNPGTATITATDTTGGTISAMTMQVFTLSGVDTSVAPAPYTASSASATSVTVSLSGTPALGWAVVNASYGTGNKVMNIAASSGSVSFTEVQNNTSQAMGYVANINSSSSTITANAGAGQGTQKMALACVVFAPYFPGPIAPTGLAATTPQANQVSLTWSDASGGQATSYKVLRATTSGGPYIVVGTPLSPSFVDATVGNAVTYYYVVQAVSAAGAGPWGEEATATAYGAPAPPTGLAAVGYGTHAALSWNIPPGGVTSYNVQRSLSSGSGYAIVATGLTSPYYLDSGLTTGTTYYYEVNAVNGTGAGLYSAPVSTTSQPLPAQNGIIAVQDGSMTSGTVALSSGGTNYQGLVPPTISKTVTVTPGASVLVVPFYIQYTNSGLSGDLTPATLDWGGQTLTKAAVSTNRFSSGISVIYYLFDPIPGTHPISFTDATGRAVYELAMNAWTLSNVDTSVLPDPRKAVDQYVGIGGLSVNYTNKLGDYVAVIATSRNGGVTKITSTTGTTNYQFTTMVNPNNIYGNQNISIGGVINLSPVANTINSADGAAGTPQNLVTAGFSRLNLGPAAPIGLTALGQENRIELSWADNSGGNATGYYILRSLISGRGYSVIGTNAGGITTTYTDTTTGNYTNYYYVVQAFNAAGYGDYSAEASAFAVGPPKIPTGLTAVGYDTSVALGWTLEPSASSYNVLRSTTSGSGFSQIASGLPTPYFTDTGLTTGTTYYYVVQAVNGYGPSASSAQASATPQPLPPLTGEILVQDGSLTTFTNKVGSSTISQPFTVTPGASVLIVAVWDQNSQTNDVNLPYALPITVTWRDQALTLVSGQQVNREKGAAAIYYLPDPTPGTDKVTATDLTTGPMLGMAMQVYTLNNVDNTQLPWIAGWADDYAQVNTGVRADYSSMGTPNGSFVAVSAAAGSGANSLHTEKIVSSSGTSTYTDAIVGSVDVAMGGVYNVVAGNALIQATNNVGGISGIIATALFPPKVLGPTAPINLVATGLTNQIALAWEDSSGGTTTSFVVLRSTSSAGGFVPVRTNVGLANVTWTDTNVTNYTIYYYEVKAINSGGSSAPSTMASAFAVGIPPVPTGLMGQWGNNQATLTWNASSNATSYKVLRSTTSGTAYTLLTSVATPGYVDTTAANYTTYYYVVNASNDIGTSSNSEQVAVTPGPGPATIEAVDGSFTSISSTNTNSISLEFTVTPGVKALVVTLFDKNNSASDVTPARLNWGSQTLVKAIGQYQVRDTLSCAVYYLYNPSPGTQIITATDTSAGPVTSMAMQAYTLTGVDTGIAPVPYGSANDYTHPYATDGGNKVTLSSGTPVGAFAAFSASIGGNQNAPIAATIVATGGTPTYGTQVGLSGYGVLMGGVASLAAGASVISVSHNTDDGIGTDLALAVFSPGAAGQYVTPNVPTIEGPWIAANGQHATVSVHTQTGYNYYLLTTPSLTQPIVWTTNSVTAGTGGYITNQVPAVGGELFMKYMCK